MFTQEKLGHWIKKAKQSRGLRTDDLAKYSSVASGQISRAEKGLSCTIITLVKLCYALQIRPLDFALEFDLQPVARFIQEREKNSSAEHIAPLGIDDITAFIALSNDTPALAKERLEMWLAEALIQQRELSQAQASEQAKRYLDETADTPLPYPTHIQIKTLERDLRGHGIMTFSDAGKLLLEIRKKRGLGLRKLANLTDISFNTLSRIERGEVERIRVRDVVELEKVLEAEGQILTIFWDAAEFHARLWMQRYRSVYSWTERDFWLAQTFFHVVRWKEASNSEEMQWLEEFRKENLPYYTDQEMQKTFDIVVSAEGNTTVLAKDILRAIYPYLPYLRSIQHKDCFQEMGKIEKFVPTSLLQIWCILLKKAEHDEVYKAVIHDFLTFSKNPDMQGAFRFYTAQVLSSGKIYQLKTYLEQLEEEEAPEYANNLPQTW